MATYSNNSTIANFTAASEITANKTVDYGYTTFPVNLKSLWDKCPNGSTITLSLSGSTIREHANAYVWAGGPSEWLKFYGVYIDDEGSVFRYKLTSTY